MLRSMLISGFAKPIVAIIFGAFILCAEACLHFESIVRPASFLDLPWHDWVAGALLLHAGVIRRANRSRGNAYLAGAWGYMTSLLAAAVIAHAEELSAPPSPEDWIPARMFFGILVVLLLVSATALVATIRERFVSA